MKTRLLFIPIILVVVATACSSGKRQLQHGNYDQAVSIAVNRLKRSPNHGKTRHALQKAYKLAVQHHMENVSYFLKTNDVAKQDKVVAEYQSIKRLNEAVRRLPDYQRLVRLQNIDDALIQHQKLAADEHVLQANNLLEQGTKHAARAAFQHLMDANYYVPGMVSSAKLDEARMAGTVVVKLNFIQKRSFFKTFNTQLFYNEVRNAFKNTNHRFLYVLEDKDATYDEVVDVELNELLVSGMSRDKETKTYTKEVLLGEVETDSGEVIEEYGTVSADYTLYRNSMTSTAILMIQRKNYGKDAPEFKKVIPSTYEWVHQWAKYNGDKRALSKEQLELAENSEPAIPNPLWMVEQASQPLLMDCARFLWTQYDYLR